MHRRPKLVRQESLRRYSKSYGIELIVRQSYECCYTRWCRWNMTARSKKRNSTAARFRRLLQLIPHMRKSPIRPELLSYLRRHQSFHPQSIGKSRNWILASIDRNNWRTNGMPLPRGLRCIPERTKRNISSVPPIWKTAPPANTAVQSKNVESRM
jgi:hypothetical protein